jgi:hypothetical protein
MQSFIEGVGVGGRWMKERDEKRETREDISLTLDIHGCIYSAYIITMNLPLL